MEKPKIAFLINPIAGMGGSVGLKGTDNMLQEAIRRGAKPVSPKRAFRYLSTLKKLGVDVFFLTPDGEMGADILARSGYSYKVVYRPSKPSTAMDTINFVREVDGEADLIVFLGGDGTARDICRADIDTPVLPVPSGVKMFSGCFALSPEAAATLTREFLRGGVEISRCEVVDIDEELYRKGVLEIRRYCSLTVVRHPEYTQSGKEATPYDAEEELEAIARQVIEDMEEEVFYITGPGRTVKKIHQLLSIDYTPLGFDAILNKSLIAKDIYEKHILEYIGRGRVKIILSPVGGSGFLLGRGNQVLTTRILSAIDIARDLIVVSPRWKLLRSRCLYIDLDDPALISHMPSQIRVVVGYREYRVVPICRA